MAVHAVLFLTDGLVDVFEAALVPILVVLTVCVFVTTLRGLICLRLPGVELEGVGFTPGGLWVVGTCFLSLSFRN